MEVLSNFFGGTLWGIMIVVAPAILLAVIGYGTIMNRGRTRRKKEHTERATQQLYREIEREDHPPQN